MRLNLPLDVDEQLNMNGELPPPPPPPPPMPPPPPSPPHQHILEPNVPPLVEYPPLVGSHPNPPMYAGLEMHALFDNAMRGILPANVHDVNNVVEAKQAFYIDAPAGLWHCTRCQAQILNQQVIYRKIHIVGLEEKIQKPLSKMWSTFKIGKI